MSGKPIQFMSLCCSPNLQKLLEILGCTLLFSHIVHSVAEFNNAHLITVRHC